MQDAVLVLFEDHGIYSNDEITMSMECNEYFPLDPTTRLCDIGVGANRRQHLYFEHGEVEILQLRGGGNPRKAARKPLKKILFIMKTGTANEAGLLHTFNSQISLIDHFKDSKFDILKTRQSLRVTKKTLMGWVDVQPEMNFTCSRLPGETFYITTVDPRVSIAQNDRFISLEGLNDILFDVWAGKHFARVSEDVNRGIVFKLNMK